mmetsp:Transcript_22205/g.32781  ORF Transcript_22205/g.32781 Transcript_22205/m.32781 type:complete len:151 (+) Transcript_22205:1048-1500(+)
MVCFQEMKIGLHSEHLFCTFSKTSVSLETIYYLHHYTFYDNARLPRNNGAQYNAMETNEIRNYLLPLSFYDNARFPRNNGAQYNAKNTNEMSRKYTRNWYVSLHQSAAGLRSLIDSDSPRAFLNTNVNLSHPKQPTNLVRHEQQSLRTIF